MGDPAQKILDAIMMQVAGKLVPSATPPVQSEPVAATPSAAEKAKAITALINETYAPAHVPEAIRRKCAKRLIETTYDKATARQYIPKRRRTKTETTPPVPVAAPTEETSEPVVVETPAVEQEETPKPALSIDSTLRKIIGVKDDGPAQ